MFSRHGRTVELACEPKLNVHQSWPVIQEKHMATTMNSKWGVYE